MSLLMEALRRAEDQKRRGQLESGAASPEAHEGPPLGVVRPAMGETKPAMETHPELKLEPLPDAAPGANWPAGENNTREADSPAAARTAAGEPRRLPDLPKRLEELDEQFLAHTTQARAARPAAFKTSGERGAPSPPPASATSPTLPPPTSRPSASPAPEIAGHDGQAAARAMFKAKRVERRRPVALIAVGLGTVAALAIGGYFWWQLQAQGGQNRLGPQPVAATGSARATITPSSPNISGTGVTEAPPPATPLPDTAAQPAAASAAPPRSSQVGDEEAAVPPSLPQPMPIADASPSRSAAPLQQPPAAVTPPVIQASLATQADDPARQAHEAYLRGEYERAEALWRSLLQADARHSDALHGLAILALRQQQPALAADYYRRALEADPRDTLALAGLLTLRGQVDPRLAESRLKSHLAEQPDSPHLNFALGNLLAQEARWAEAQQAYFNAHAADPDSPDILFNLAVSLDQLRQPALAARYYRQALAAATSRPAGFDGREVEARLRQLVGEGQ